MNEQRSTLRLAALELFAASSLVLFQELALIRWFPGQVRVLAYFPNLILISAFLGLGVGCLRADRRALTWLWPASLLVTVLAARMMSGIVFTQQSVSEHLWLLYYDLPEDAYVYHGVRLPIVVAFVLTGITFVPLGQLVAERLRLFGKASATLWGYCWDLGGSLAGVILFSAMSLAGSFPRVWFLVIMVLGAVFFRRGKTRLTAYVFCAGVVLFVVHTGERAQLYSPYYALSAKNTAKGSPVVDIMANGSLHQYAVALREADTMSNPQHATARDGYHFPYRQLKQAPEHALVLGAGTGNDVAVLLDEGVGRVDAVEIDPVIIELGRKHHPNNPYASERVRVYCTDARSFLNNTTNRYDLVVFGTLDSMTRLSALSNVRLDNFVYTIESLRAARACLKPDGGMVLYFMVATQFIHDHLLGMLTEVFGDVPLVENRFATFFNHIYMAGPAFAHLEDRPQAARDAFRRDFLPGLSLPTDDWPYLYLRGRSVSTFYLTLIALFLAIATASVLLVSPEMRRSVSQRKRMDAEMFFFGVGFLLLETKFVTSMNLIWGATWLTSAVVFGSVLLVILLATILMKLRPLPWRVSSACLIAALAAAYLIEPHSFLGADTPFRLVLCILYVGLPVFFASACFAVSFAARERPDLAFGWNLLGAVTGGLLELFSMAAGFRAMILAAGVAYLLVILIRRHRGDLRRNWGRPLNSETNATG